MEINAIGLGLIGGSLCKALKKHTKHTIFGADINEKTLADALSSGAVDGIADDLGRADITVISLYPEDTVEFIIKNAERFKKGSIVTDVCGVKKAVTDRVSPVLAQNGVTFVGAHPMAGREFSGFAYAADDLFDNASLIITPTEYVAKRELGIITDFWRSLRFKRIVTASPEEHDGIIAFTSQLAHVVSNAYIKSPTHKKRLGFSAGSYEDLTRVAKLNEEMWTSLFMLNKEPLCFEIDHIINRLNEYKAALEAGEYDKLKSLLREGRILKEL